MLQLLENVLPQVFEDVYTRLKLSVSKKYTRRYWVSAPSAGSGLPVR